MSAREPIRVDTVPDAYMGYLVEALVQGCPSLEQSFELPVPIFPSRDCAVMGLRTPLEHSVHGGWLCQPLGLLLTYQEALLSVWGLSPAETYSIYCGAGAPVVGQIIDRVASLVRISITIEVLMCPEDHGRAWLNTERDDWSGRSPKDWMIAGRLDETEYKLMEELRNERK